MSSFELTFNEMVLQWTENGFVIDSIDKATDLIGPDSETGLIDYHFNDRIVKPRAILGTYTCFYFARLLIYFTAQLGYDIHIQVHDTSSGSALLDLPLTMHDGLYIILLHFILN